MSTNVLLQTLAAARSLSDLAQVGGHVHVATAGHLTDVVRSLPPGPAGEVRLDLSELSFVDAAGLTALVQVRAGGRRLVLHRPRPPVLRLLDVTDLAGSFDIGPACSLPRDRERLIRVGRRHRGTHCPMV